MGLQVDLDGAQVDLEGVQVDLEGVQDNLERGTRRFGDMIIIFLEGRHLFSENIINLTAFSIALQRNKIPKFSGCLPAAGGGYMTWNPLTWTPLIFSNLTWTPLHGGPCRDMDPLLH